MKYFLLLLGLFSNLPFLNAQIQKLSVHQSVLSYQLDLSKDLLSLNSRNDIPLNSKKFLTASTTLSDGELVINYQLASPEKEGYYLVSLEISMNDQVIKTSPGYLFGDLGKIQPTENIEQQIVWTNLISQLPAGQGELQLRLKAEFWGIQFLAFGVDCNKYPQFGIKQKMPFYAGLAGGVACLATGAVLKNKALNHLDQHRIANTLAERNGQYQEYKDKTKQAELISYIGIGVIVADALLYLARRERHRKRIRIFETHCDESRLSIAPIWGPAVAENAQQLSLRLSYQF